MEKDTQSIEKEDDLKNKDTSNKKESSAKNNGEVKQNKSGASPAENKDDVSKNLNLIENELKASETNAEANWPMTKDEKNLDEVDLKYKDKSEVAKGGLLGFFIGLAVIVPGVSGSAVAIIFKLYEKLLYALGNIFKKFKMCVLFLLPILVGAVVGFGLGFFGVKELLNLIPFAIIAFFAGLMFGAYPAVTDEIKGEKKTVKRVLLFVLGVLVPVAITLATTFVGGGTFSLDNLKFYHYILFLIAGFLVAITQIVPGLSATALLMSFGMFSPLMNSVSLSYWKENPSVLLVYVCLVVGFVIGLVLVSKLLTKIFKKYHAPAFFVISGLSLGSIITMFFNSEVLEVYKTWTSSGIIARDVCLGVFLLAIGIVLAYMLVRYERKKNNTETNQ